MRQLAPRAEPSGQLRVLRVDQQWEEGRDRPPPDARPDSSDRSADGRPTVPYSRSDARTRRRSSRYATPRPAGTATGSPAIRPPAPTRTSNHRAPASAPTSTTPPTPVAANLQPTCRSNPRAIASPGRGGSTRWTRQTDRNRHGIGHQRCGRSPSRRNRRRVGSAIGRKCGGDAPQGVLRAYGQQIVEPDRQARDDP
jgi:hypothetical protein